MLDSSESEDADFFCFFYNLELPLLASLFVNELLPVINQRIT